MIENKQPAESLDHNSNELDVHSIFYTIQGEGPHSGRPAVFIRLAGCNLQCQRCDTDYTSYRKKMNISEIMEKANRYPTRLMIISGGEPFRQNLIQLINCLLALQLEVQIETNGTICPEWVKEKFYLGLKVVICPKTPSIAQEWQWVPNEMISYKYVVEKDKTDKDDGLPITVLGKSIRPARPFAHTIPSEIYLQPEDTGGKMTSDANRDHCVGVCMRFGYRLCLQIHKIVNLP